MTNKEARAYITEWMKDEFALNKNDREALDMAIQALENIGHLKDRPCSVCEFKKENGCCKWTCVFTDKLFGGMNE